MKYFNLSAFVLFLYALVPLPAFGQEDIGNIENDTKLRSDHYSTLSLGSNTPTYRDFATSPLFYSGLGIDFQFGKLKRSEKRERYFDFAVGANVLFANIPESDFLQAETFASLVQLNFTYAQLFALERFNSGKNNFKVGGVLRATQNVRTNASLFNNGLGLENAINLMASGQIIRDVSRKEQKQLNLWLFKPTLKPVKRDVRFQLNAGVLNFNNRPGYAYSYQGEIIGVETEPFLWAISTYETSLNGWRLNTELEFIRYLPNGNARSWSYVWDALEMPGRHESFQMANHQIKYKIFFHTKR